MDIKAKFHFATEALDSRTTVVKVKSIQLINQAEIFLFPPNMQTNVHHKLLFDHPVTKGVVKSLKARNKFRNVTITLTEGDLRDTYLDQEGNVVFNEYYLETDTACTPSVSFPSHTPIQEKTIHSISKDFTLEKFNGKNYNAEAWLKSFVAECARLNVPESKYPEVLRLFVDETAMEWYSVFLKSNTVSQTWEFWNNSFIDTFNKKSWSEIEYAYTFKYFNGQILDFALKKRSLILDVDPDLTIKSQINLIIIAFPPFIRNRLEGKNFEKIDDLMSLLRQIEPSRNKSKLNANVDTDKFQGSVKFVDKQRNQNSHEQCSYCKSIGFPNRFHPEKLCRTKAANQNKFGNDKIKVSNNLELQDMISFAAEAKNE